MRDGDDLLGLLAPKDRATLRAICEAQGVTPAALIPEFVAAYLRLMREVPEALPRNPLEPIYAGAKRRAKS